AGKTSLMKSLRKKIDPNCCQPSFIEPEKVEMTLWNFCKRIMKKGKMDENQELNSSVLTVWFNAWRYSKDEQLWAALVKSIIEQSTGRMNVIKREQFLMELNMKRIDIDKIRRVIYQNILIRTIPVLFVGVAILILTLMLGLNIIYGSVFIIISFLYKFRSYFKEPLSSFKLDNYVKHLQYDKKIGFIDEVEKDFMDVQHQLLRKNEKLVVFIDDLDRCAPKKIIDIIEAINLFFGNEECKCIFVLGIDNEFVAKSIECEYDQLAQKLETKNFGMHFLQKIVQVIFTLPEPSSDQLKDYLNYIIDPLKQDVEKRSDPNIVRKIGDQLHNNAPDVTKINDAAYRLELSPEEQAALEEAKIETAVEMLTENDPKVREVLEEGLNYLEKNPRQIKRGKRVFRLEALISIRQRGPLGKDDFQQLAKLVAVSMLYPEILKKMRLTPSILTLLEDAAHDEDEWTKLINESEFKGVIDMHAINIFKNSVKLSNINIDHTIS
ncbi:MAG: hypothetical protein KAR20_24280, partial [Candidatus Heimdallarchaeota archaeon]|nr:hypothetical protein [Candidatus Heimdallarchaeota archaeon]